MNSTEEKMMEETMENTQMADEKMPEESMAEEKTIVADDNSKMKISKEEAFMGLLKNKMILLDEEYTEASRRQTDRYHDDRYGTAHYESIEKTKIIRAKMSVIRELQKCWEEMMTPVAV